MPTLTCLLELYLIVCSLPLAELRRREHSRSSSSRSRSTPECSSESVTTTGLPTVGPTEIDPATFCSMVFDSIGPFCQFVVADEESLTCRVEITDDTCESCRNIINSCGTFNGSICESDLASTCSEPQTETFLTEYCARVSSQCIPAGVVNNPISEGPSSSSAAAAQSAVGTAVTEGASTGISGSERPTKVHLAGSSKASSSRNNTSVRQ